MNVIIAFITGAALASVFWWVKVDGLKARLAEASRNDHRDAKGRFTSSPT